jgi:GxxExxY protein
MSKLIHKDLSYTVRGVLFDVYNHFGPMLPENIYEGAIGIGLEAKGIKCRTEKEFEVYYRDQRVGHYFVDVWIEQGKTILELKVAAAIVPLHQAQAISYLKVTGADLAFVVNFGAKSLEDQRLPNFVRDKAPIFVWEKRPLELDLPYSDLTAQILEACHRVHFELGPGFLHHVYRRAIMIELQHQRINYEYIKQIPLAYQGHTLAMQEVRLIVVAEKVVLAAVAVKQIDDFSIVINRSPVGFDQKLAQGRGVCQGNSPARPGFAEGLFG